MRGLGRIKRGFQRVRRYFAPAAVILMYHRIANLPVDPYGNVVSPDRFAQHLEWIRQTCHAMRLCDLTEAAQTKSLAGRTVVITFDDGYVDFYTQAFPRLASAKIPATVFVTSGLTDTCARFWSDELTRLILMPDNLPPQLQLEVQAREYRWSITSPSDRQRLHEAVYHLLKPLAPAEQSDCLAYLASWSGVGQPGGAEDRFMASSELIQLAGDGLVDIGAHTVHHPTLSALPAAAQSDEIVGSRRSLEAVLGRPVLTFAYPYGQAEDFTDETVEAVAAAGFHAACTTIPGVVDAASNPHRLRRYWVGNWDLGTFKKNLEWFFLQ
jgi:peptidoglycan/xylan/chitin deacetylase (PgdA/CDA1 family)